MRNWEWLVPVIAVAVWILSSLLRGSEEDRRAKRLRSVPDPDRPPPDRPRRAASDIDLFLEEVNRRRRQSGERRTPGPGFEVPPAAPLPPTAPPTPRTPARRQPARQAAERPGKRATKSEAVVVAEVMPVTPDAPRPPAELSRVAARQTSPALKQLAGLLRSPQSLGAAFLLREILDQPLCRRRRAPM